MLSLLKPTVIRANNATHLGKSNRCVSDKAKKRFKLGQTPPDPAHCNTHTDLLFSLTHRIEGRRAEARSKGQLHRTLYYLGKQENCQHK